MVDSLPEEIPLNPTDSNKTKQQQTTVQQDIDRNQNCQTNLTSNHLYAINNYSNFTNNGYDSAIEDAERNLLNVHVPTGVHCKFLQKSHSNTSGSDQQSNENRSLNSNLSQQQQQQQQQQHQQQKATKRNKSTNNLRDINAMSVASIYDREDKEIMDADNAMMSEISINPSRQRASKETDNDSELNTLLPSTSRDSVTGTPVSLRYQKNHPADCESCYAEPPDPFTNATNTQTTSLFFTDGERSIDFVIVWKPCDDPTQEQLRCIKRAIFEENLFNEGLELERESHENLHFTKIHAPIEVLRRYAEILKLRMPMKESLCKVHERNRLSRLSNAALYISNKIPGIRGVQNTTASVLAQLKGFGHKAAKAMSVDEKHFPKRSMRFTAVYSRDKEYLFDVYQACFFTAAIRSRIVQFILDRKRFTLGADDDYAFGIDRLIDEQVYIAAYPLHDGEVSIPGSIRHLLYTEWANVSKWYRYQPLDYVKEYFGVKIGLYFAWLGYYTYMLLLASIVGIACFLYSLLTMNSHIPSNEICSGKLNVTMCPLCDHLCDYWPLSETCMHVKITYLFDNSTTVFFAIFMSFWATLFLELWKRYSAEITHRWDLTGFDIHEEHPRPQYLARLAHVKKIRIDYITNTKEPQPPFWRMKLPAAVFSFSIVILLVALAFAAVLGVVLYRMSVLAALSVNADQLTTSHAILFTTITAALINLCLIIVFNWFYNWLAECLTEFEILRTQTEFDDSLTLKIYLFQFVNYYASIFYIAFFKGKFIGYPREYNRFIGYRQEECGLGGCLTELCIQLAIIMVGKQAMNTVLEMVSARLYKWYNGVKVRLLSNQNATAESERKNGQRWVRDLKLVEWGPQSLFNEYLEMVLQYGFVTIFVAAFPLAPFFALLNNILEMRFDAKKLLKFYRRPVSQRVRDIGVWYRILDCIGKLSVITNGFIIAFTSEFIPRLVYQLTISKDGTLNGYVNHSLAYFNTSNFNDGKQPRTPTANTTMCRYPDYREPPDSQNAYDRTYLYWYILAARLAFIVVFENFVAVVMILVRWGIPDMSAKLRDQIRREAYITNEIIIKQEALRVRQSNTRENSVRLGNTPEPQMDMARIEQLMKGNLSSSQLDLVMHGEPGDPIAPGHCEPRQYENEDLSKAFIESEKSGGRKIDEGEPFTETSAL